MPWVLADDMVGMGRGKGTPGERRQSAGVPGAQAAQGSAHPSGGGAGGVMAMEEVLFRSWACRRAMRARTPRAAICVAVLCCGCSGGSAEGPEPGPCSGIAQGPDPGPCSGTAQGPEPVR